MNYQGLLAMLRYVEDNQEEHKYDEIRHTYWCGWEDALLVVKQILDRIELKENQNV